MRVLGIETSCDETSAAIVEDGCAVLSCITATSESEFASLGGVIPEQAARAQVECVLPTIDLSLKKAAMKPEDIDFIAVTSGPGLLGSLLVGTCTAQVMKSIWKKPLIGVHHTLGHLSSTWLFPAAETSFCSSQDKLHLSFDNYNEPQFPILTLSVSGGHSDLWYRTSHTQGKLLGSTRDDAAGEAFDKGASLLGLPYPGGPALAKLAEGGNEHAFVFPDPLRHENTLDFSFSGLKTALKYTLRDLALPSPAHGGGIRDGGTDLAASYQLAICIHLIHQLQRAVELYLDVKEIHIVGGVSANRRLRQMTEELGQQNAKTVRYPLTLPYCTDNAAMIAAAGYFLAKEQPERIGQLLKAEATMHLTDLLQASITVC